MIKVVKSSIISEMTIVEKNLFIYFIKVFRSLTFPVYDNKCDNGWYENGDDLLLSCLLTVGNPPRIPRWCRKLENEKFFTDLYNKTNTFNGNLKRQGCQYERISFLQYRIAETDTGTQLVCVVTDNECNTIQPNNIFMIKTLTGMCNDPLMCGLGTIEKQVINNMINITL